MRIRAAHATDAMAIARVHVTSWRDTYAGVLPTEYLARRLNEARQAAYWQTDLDRPRAGHVTLVAEDDDLMVGFAAGGPARAKGDYAGELYALYVLGDHHGKGVGRLLCTRVAQKLLEGGVESMYVEVLEANPSRFFYEAIGGLRFDRQMHAFAGVKLPVILYGWPDLIPLAGNLPRR